MGNKASKVNKPNTGKRYSDKEKQEIINFIQSQGRGGKIAAQRKYGVSYIALSRWLKGVEIGKAAGMPTKDIAAQASIVQKEVARQLAPIKKALATFHKALAGVAA